MRYFRAAGHLLPVLAMAAFGTLWLALSWAYRPVDTRAAAEAPSSELWLQVPDSLPPSQAQIGVNWIAEDGTLRPWRNYLVDTNGRATDLDAVSIGPPLAVGAYSVQILPGGFASAALARTAHAEGGRSASSASRDSHISILPYFSHGDGSFGSSSRMRIQLGKTAVQQTQVKITAAALGTITETFTLTRTVSQSMPLEVDASELLPSGTRGTAYVVADDSVAVVVETENENDGIGMPVHSYPGLSYEEMSSSLSAPLIRVGRVADASVPGSPTRYSRIAVQRNNTGSPASLTVTYHGDDIDGNACRNQTIVHGGGAIPIPANTDGLWIDPQTGGLPEDCQASAILSSDDLMAAVIIEEDVLGAAAAAYPAIPSGLNEDEALGPRFQNETQGLRTVVHAMNPGSSPAQVQLRFIYVESGSTREKTETLSVPAGAAARWTPAGLGVPPGLAGTVIVKSYQKAPIAVMLESIPTDGDSDGEMYAAGRRPQSSDGTPQGWPWHLIPRTWRSGPQQATATSSVDTPTVTATSTSTAPPSPTATSGPSATPGASHTPAPCSMTFDVGIVAYAGNGRTEQLYDAALYSELINWGSLSGATAGVALYPRDVHVPVEEANIDGYGAWLEGQLRQDKAFEGVEFCADAWLVVTPYNDLVHNHESLLPITLDDSPAPGDFLEAAWSKAQMPPGGGPSVTKALPWQRDECTDSYRFLGIASVSKDPGYGQDLAHFLIQPRSQEANYQPDSEDFRLGFPTLKEPYVTGWPSGAPAIMCPSVDPLPPEVEGQIDRAEREARDTAEALAGILPSYDPGGDLAGPKLSQVVSFALPDTLLAATGNERLHGKRDAMQADGLILAGTVMDYEDVVSSEEMSAWLDRAEGVIVGQITIYPSDGGDEKRIFLPFAVTTGGSLQVSAVLADRLTIPSIASAPRIEEPLRYAVRWHREDGEIVTSYVTPEGETLSDSEIASHVGIPVLSEPVLGPEDGVEPSSETAVWTAKGSRKYCLKVDSRRYCLSFG